MKAQPFRPEWHLVHPFLAGLYPVLNLYAANMEWVMAVALLRMVVPIGAMTGLLLWLLKPVVPRLGGRAFVVTLFYINFYLVSPYALTALKPHLPPGLSPESLSLLPVGSALYLGILLLVAILLVRKSRYEFRPATIGLNVFAATLMLFNAGEIVRAYRTSLHGQGVGVAWAGTTEEESLPVQAPWYPAAEAFVEEALDQPLTAPATRPDIYYIVFDAYGRDDILDEYYQFRDQAFLDYLASRDFYIAGRSHSNYAQTYFSLASALNLNYLDPIQQVMGPETRNREPLRYLVEHNGVVRALKEMGYQYVFLASNYHATMKSPLADRCYCDTRSLREFERAVLVRTALGFWMPDRTQYDEHRDTILSTFYHLQNLPDLDTPMFVFAHIVAPHPPFVLDRDGRMRRPDMPFGFEDGDHFMGTHEEYMDGYRGQVAYVNREIRRTVERILARSEVPPIMILQGDHGPGSRLDWSSAARTDMRERMSIFNAYHFPGGGGANLYDEITPVNTFRVLFDHYFGADYRLLADRSFFALWTRPYDLMEVTPGRQE
jgi:hypothetical protein